MELLPEYVYSILVFIAIPLIAQGVKLWRRKLNPSPSLQREAITALVFVLSIVAGLLFFAPELPVFGDNPIAYIGTLLAAGAPWFAAVEVVYNFILKRLFEAVGWS